jgi:trans-aconitate methyltransferase
MSEQAFDAYAGAYDAALNRGLSLSGESKEYFAHTRIRWTAARLARAGCRPRHVLDFGCGTGASAPELLEQLQAATVTGIDTSPESIALATEQHANGLVRFATIEAIRPSGQYDFVYCNGVFHHIEPEDRPAALAYISQSLSPTGYFALWENNPRNPGTRLVMKRIPFDRDAKPLSAPAARRLLRAAGFEVLSTDFLFLFPRLLAALRPLEPRLARLPAGAQYLVLCRRR